MYITILGILAVPWSCGDPLRSNVMTRPSLKRPNGEGPVFPHGLNVAEHGVYTLNWQFQSGRS